MIARKSIRVSAAILFAAATANAQEIIKVATSGNLEKVKELVVANPLDFDVAGNGLYWQFSFDQDESIYFSTDKGFFRQLFIRRDSPDGLA